MSKNSTILFVEDDDTFRYAACRFLKAQGFSVVDVQGSMAALRVIDEGNVDAMIADVALGPNEPHGIALARMVRVKHPEMPMLFVTGNKDIERIEAGIPGEVLYKPIELADLSRKIGRLLT